MGSNAGEDMTTLVAWLGVDSRGPSSLYLAADSRFTWAPGETWDYGRKLFASRSSPVILGYCGDVLFASHGIGQALELLEAQVLHPTDAEPSRRVDALAEFLRSALNTYPRSQQRAFSVLYAWRVGPAKTPSFFLAELDWSNPGGWTTVVRELPTGSGLILARGSGKPAFDATFAKWKGSDVGSTSRAVYSAFCEHTSSGADPLTGGVPQLVGLYRTGFAVTFGMVHSGARWISGARVPDGEVPPDIEWRDGLFQRCDGNTLSVRAGAQRHARPRSA